MTPLRIFISSVQQEFAEAIVNAVVHHDDTSIGTGDMIRRCRNASLPEPEFALTDGFVTIIRRQTREVQRVVLVLYGEMKRIAIQHILGLRHDDYFRKAYLSPALASGYIEMTIPGRSNSRLQRYRLTEKGMALLAVLRKERAP